MEEARARVVDARRQDDISTIVLEVVSRPFTEDDDSWPASLFALENPNRNIIELHRLVERKENVLTFHSFDLRNPLPQNEQAYIFRILWAPWQRDIASDMDLVWKREAYPDNGDHAHCALSWETISSYSGERDGYLSGTTWITVEYYEKYIRDDVLRIRHRKHL